jgi:hypothetical protein
MERGLEKQKKELHFTFRECENMQVDARSVVVKYIIASDLKFSLGDLKYSTACAGGREEKQTGENRKRKVIVRVNFHCSPEVYVFLSKVAC